MSVISAGLSRILQAPTEIYIAPAAIACAVTTLFLLAIWRQPAASLEPSQSNAKGEERRIARDKPQDERENGGVFLYAPIPLISAYGPCRCPICGYTAWTPVEFRYPKFDAWPFELSETKPIPYRPFRWGSYHVTMGTRNMPWADWIELDNQYQEYQRIRAHRVQTQGDGVVRVLDDNANPAVKGGQLAGKESSTLQGNFLSSH
ncbi:hypothetical protein NP233_g5738 [Leucocoprinus birnbaumii]|uniref:Uncharacterized protein n=1 Tax=Leucocoprinus birnbaumii TaxID=56174 RepID=A0AAD5VUM0_9AGAR|nr:hypothetical protein NP233_g5738 [Leucocoprinus birnbaumii]